MAVLGTLSSVNLIAGAGLLGNIGGVALSANTDLSNNISTYTSINVVSQFAAVATTGYVSINVVASSLPALTNAVPSAYQANLGSGTLTQVISTQSANIMGSGDLGKFEQTLGSSIALVQQTNQLIKSVINANSANYVTGFVSQDNVITGSLSGWTLAFPAVSTDLLKLGSLINFENLGSLGSPNALLRQVYSLSSLPGLNDALLFAGISEDSIDNLSTDDLTDAEQKLAYQAMTTVTGTTLAQILNLLKVTTTGIETMADLLNPVKIFPTSFITFTTTTVNGLRGVYLDNFGTVNSALATELPENVLRPLQGNPQADVVTYEQLRRIIPSDQALANKAIQVALEQVKTIFNTSAVPLGVATSGLETDYGLAAINALTEPLPANVVAFYQDTYTTGTGEDGLLLLADVMGTPSGWVHNQALSNTISILNQLTSANVFSNLTNSYNGVYTVMANTAAGSYTTETNPGVEWTTTIPVGLPGAGSYVAANATASIQSAFTSGLTPNMIANVNIIITNNSADTTQLNNNWANISAQIIRENVNLNLAGINFANLTPGLQPIGLVTGLTQYGVDTAQGGAAYIIEALANINSIGGQAVISTMREARNLVRLSEAGIDTNIIVSDEVAEPQAILSDGQYTVSQAIGQKII